MTSEEVTIELDAARAAVARRWIEAAGLDKGEVCAKVAGMLGRSVSYCEDAFWGLPRTPSFWRTLIAGVLGQSYNTFEDDAMILVIHFERKRRIKELDTSSEGV